eukprot:TRINITY_DN6688_c0_g1_i5.p2 TRINITY_DN6688_c0_g1~~TRINITY_DN6688_c0_g1_i5.p2  ORF type:complete len:170 (+),score=20.55 TRINITY_DN6688_c0_g1_i5:1057-1566(+)
MSSADLCNYDFLLQKKNWIYDECESFADGILKKGLDAIMVDIVERIRTYYNAAKHRDRSINNAIYARSVIGTLQFDNILMMRDIAGWIFDYQQVVFSSDFEEFQSLTLNLKILFLTVICASLLTMYFWALRGPWKDVRRLSITKQLLSFVKEEFYSNILINNEEALPLK